MCKDDEDAKDQDARLNHLVIPLDNRLIDNAADTRPGEYHFLHDGADREVSKLQTADCTSVNYSFTKCVFERDLAFRLAK